MDRIAALVAATGERVGEPVGFLVFAASLIAVGAWSDRRAALAYAGTVVAATAILVLLRIASRAQLLGTGPFFPSGHVGVTVIVAACTVAWIEHGTGRAAPALRIAALALGGLVGLGRWLAEAHPAPDIVAGLAIGVLAGWVLARLLRPRPPQRSWRIRTPMLAALLAACHVVSHATLPRASDLLRLL